MKATHQLWYVAAGLTMVCIFFLMPPWTTANVILGIVPLFFLIIIGITLYRARKNMPNGDIDDESGE